MLTTDVHTKYDLKVTLRLTSELPDALLEFDQPPSPDIQADLAALSNESVEITIINEFDYFINIWDLSLNPHAVVERVITYLEQVHNLKVLRVADSFVQTNH